MKIIILDKIKNLGDVGDIINVRPGYARNFLFPKGKATTATSQNILSFKENQKQLNNKLAEDIIIAKSKAEKINKLGIVTIISKSGNKGKLFGSIGVRNIANAVTSAGIEVSKSEVRLPNGVLKTIGEHEVYFHLHSKISAKLVVNIISS
ncbi:50S ribosomal protein L9 [Candidatus Pantoea edessiphila]|uniref:Large ribosomal subunit protein bL9 n=1 Tax=Candidatus Pantoea edessiphila TaxID=2044610 RepID=A0A2P5T1N1_9GAMM|nr:50S ribosomal protein L9 [Candidatus Pantoea edessiphila]PPI88504.1 50S ribosomal protein L9 [Candidatus Pantoea edessiphila]